MIEQEARSTERLPFAHRKWDHLKQRAELLAERVELFDKHKADRIAHCADIVRFNQAKNGFTYFKDSRFCHVRGCPICEHNLARNRAGHSKNLVLRASKLERNYNFLLLKFRLNPFPIEDIKTALDLSSHAYQKLVKRKVFKAAGHVVVKSLSVGFGLVNVETNLICLSPVSAFAGQNYIKRSEWSDLWSQSVGYQCPEAEKKNLKLDWRAIRSVISSAGFLDLSLVLDCDLKPFMQGIDRRKLLLKAGIVSELWEFENKGKKKYYPSEKKNLDAVQKTLYAYAPNPATYNPRSHDIDFEYTKYSHCGDNEAI